jgi:peptidoglycan/LPS O-acetylase OafA/YrhL
MSFLEPARELDGPISLGEDGAALAEKEEGPSPHSGFSGKPSATDNEVSAGYNALPKRLPPLDLLRAVAFLLVLGGHGVSDQLGPVGVLWKSGGWIGVDLFFVLSGFLIGGLLFSEYRRHGAVSFKRFFIRRGLKIYPPFLAVVITTIIVRALRAEPMTWRQIFGEFTFLQNYLAKLWPQNWSLAVEEHFYIMLPLGLLFLIRRKANLIDPFASIPRLFLALAAVMLCIRFANAWLFRNYTAPRHMQGTHLRIDSLMFGVLCAYYYHFRHEDFVRFVFPKRRLLAAAGVLLLLPPFFIRLELTPWMYTIGFTLFYLGAGMLLAAMVVRIAPLGPVTAAFALLGAYSYSIYLWHLAFRNWICPPLEQYFGLQHGWTWFTLYMCGATIFGIFMAKIVEFPMLRLRDRFFPSRSAAIPQG